MYRAKHKIGGSCRTRKIPGAEPDEIYGRKTNVRLSSSLSFPRSMAGRLSLSLGEFAAYRKSLIVRADAGVNLL